MSTADDQARDDGGTQTVDLARHRAKRMRQRLLLVVDHLLHAIEQRDAERVWMLLDDPDHPLSQDDYPPVGSQVRAVVIGTTDHNHQIRLSMRLSDLERSRA